MTVVALRFFFKVTLERDDLVRRLTLVSEPRSVVERPSRLRHHGHGWGRRRPRLRDEGAGSRRVRQKSSDLKEAHLWTPE